MNTRITNTDISTSASTFFTNFGFRKKITHIELQSIALDTNTDVGVILNQDKEEDPVGSIELKESTTITTKISKEKKRNKSMSPEMRVRFKKRVLEITQFLNQAEEKSNQKYLESIKKSPTK